MEVLRRRKDDEKSKQEEAQEKAKQEANLKHGQSGIDSAEAPKKVQKDDSLEKMMHQQLNDWEKAQKDAEEEAKKERPTLHNINLPDLKPAAFGVWRAFHEMSYPLPKDVAEDLDESGISMEVQETFKLGFNENLLETGQAIARKFGSEELQAAGFPLLKDYAQKNVPALVFPYWRDDEICFMSLRALLSREERNELNIPRYIRLGTRIPFPYNAGVFDHILDRERKKVFFLYPSRYRLNIISKEEDVLVVAEKGFDAIAIRDFYLEEEWLKLFVHVEPVVIIDTSDRTYEGWEKKVDILKAQFAQHDMVMRIEILPEGVDVPQWFVKSNLGERTFKREKPPQTGKPHK